MGIEIFGNPLYCDSCWHACLKHSDMGALGITIAKPSEAEKLGGI